MVETLASDIVHNIRAHIYSPDEDYWCGAAAINIKQLGRHRGVLDMLGADFISTLSTNISEDMITYNPPQIMMYYDHGWKIKLEWYMLDDDVGDRIFNIAESVVCEFIILLLQKLIIPYDCSSKPVVSRTELADILLSGMV